MKDRYKRILDVVCTGVKNSIKMNEPMNIYYVYKKERRGLRNVVNESLIDTDLFV